MPPPDFFRQPPVVNAAIEDVYLVCERPQSTAKIFTSQCENHWNQIFVNGISTSRTQATSATLPDVELSKYRPVGNLERVDTLTRQSQKSWF